MKGEGNRHLWASPLRSKVVESKIIGDGDLSRPAYRGSGDGEIEGVCCARRPFGDNVGERTHGERKGSPRKS